MNDETPNPVAEPANAAHELVVYYLENKRGKRIVGPFFTRDEARLVENFAPELKVVAYDVTRRPERAGGGA